MFPTDGEVDSPVSGAWLYNGVADLAWAKHINSEDLQTFRRNGFYSTLVRPGLRIISINTNFCAGENFFLLLGFADPAGQLAWLAEELLRSEEAGEKVHILGHHPLHSCLQAVLHSHAPHTPHCVVRTGHALGHHSDASRHCCLCPTSLGHWHCTAPGKKGEKKLHFELLMFTQDLRVHLMAGIC